MPEIFARRSRASRLERVLVEVKQHVGHADDQSAGGVSRLQDLIELRQQAGAHLFFLPDSLLRLLLRCLRLILSLFFLAFRLFALLLGCCQLVLSFLHLALGVLGSLARCLRLCLRLLLLS